VRPVSSDFVRDFYLALHSPRPEQAAERFLAPDYLEHQASAEFSKSGLVRWAQARQDAAPRRRVIIHRAIADQNFVFLHVEERLSNSECYARGELFRVQGERIAEHWSAAVRDVAERMNPHGSFDGPQPDLNSDAARQSVERFQALDARGFNDWDFDAFRQSRTPRYVQHSPTGEDTVQGLVAILKYVKGLGIKMSMRNYRTLVAGDFIVTHRLYRTSPPFKDFRMINVFDLFRFDGTGRADEHWDIMEEIEREEHIPRIF
jgi:predicted SnoaL-like aldol condensation-catalyzing enzyme